MKTEKEKLPVESETQPLQEEELNEVNGGTMPGWYQHPTKPERPILCTYCHNRFTKDVLEEHMLNCSKRPQ